MKKLRLICILPLLLALSVITGCQRNTDTVEIVSEEIVKDAGSAGDKLAGNTQMVSPITELKNSDDIYQQLEISMVLPTGATYSSYCLIDDTIAQEEFIYNGVAYTYRGSKIYKDQELDGVYETFTDSYFNIDLNGYDFELYTTTNGNRLAAWTIDDVNFSLYSDESVDNTVLEGLLLSLVFGENSFDTALETAEEMTGIFHGMNCYLFDHENSYMPEDSEAYWTSILYVVNQCETILQEECTLENETYKISGGSLEKLVLNLYGKGPEINQVAIPDSLKDKIQYDQEQDIYYFSLGEAGAVNTKVTFASKNEEGILIVETQYCDSETGEVLETYHYTLMSAEASQVAENQNTGIFPYNITKVSGTEMRKVEE